MIVDPTQYNNECFIVGGGPSLIGFDWSVLNNKFVIAINRSYEVCPTAQVLYFTDPDYWERHKDKMKKHGGHIIRGATSLGITKDDRVQEYLLTGSRGLETQPGCLRHGNNSTYAAINLALLHFNFSTVYLLGIDMKWTNKKTHWHNGHARIDPEHSYDMMKQAYQLMSHDLKTNWPYKRVINVNKGSNLTCFPEVPHEIVFGPDCFNK